MTVKRELFEAVCHALDDVLGAIRSDLDNVPQGVIDEAYKAAKLLEHMNFQRQTTMTGNRADVQA